MTQVVSNRTGREKIITAEGENTEFSVEVKKQKNNDDDDDLDNNECVGSTDNSVKSVSLLLLF